MSRKLRDERYFCLTRLTAAHTVLFSCSQSFMRHHLFPSWARGTVNDSVGRCTLGSLFTYCGLYDFHLLVTTCTRVFKFTDVCYRFAATLPTFSLVVHKNIKTTVAVTSDRLAVRFPLHGFVSRASDYSRKAKWNDDSYSHSNNYPNEMQLSEILSCANYCRFFFFSCL